MRREACSTKKWHFFGRGVPRFACQTVRCTPASPIDKQSVALLDVATFLCCILREAKRWAVLSVGLLAAVAAGCSDPADQLNSDDPAARIEAIRALAQQRTDAAAGKNARRAIPSLRGCGVDKVALTVACRPSKRSCAVGGARAT